MLYNELDMRDFEVAVETALLEDEELMDWILSEMEEEEADIETAIIEEEPKQLLMVKGEFEVKDPFYDETLIGEVHGSTRDKMMEKFSKELERIKETAKLYGHQTPREAELMALTSLTITEYYE
jgi:hypothetical protein